jgi:hypothetical protein
VKFSPKAQKATLFVSLRIGELKQLRLKEWGLFFSGN